MSCFIWSFPSRLRDGPDDTFALQVGTIWDDGEFRFFFSLTTGDDDDEGVTTETMESVLHLPTSEDGLELEFCEDCVWTVVVEWEVSKEGDNNLIVHHTFLQETTKTVRNDVA